MKDRIRYSEAFKLKVMEELRDAKWKSVKEAATAYGIAEMSVYNWMRKLGFEHLNENMGTDPAGCGVFQWKVTVLTSY